RPHSPRVGDSVDRGAVRAADRFAFRAGALAVVPHHPAVPRTTEYGSPERPQLVTSDSDLRVLVGRLPPDGIGVRPHRAAVRPSHGAAREAEELWAQPPR